MSSDKASEFFGNALPKEGKPTFEQLKTAVLATTKRRPEIVEEATHTLISLALLQARATIRLEALRSKYS